MWAPLITPHRRHRQRKRRAVSLQDRSITSNTRIRYFVAVTAVLPALEKTTDDIDDFLVEWIDQEYIRGSSITSVAATLSGLHHFMPWCRGKIRAAWKLYGLWRRSERPRQAPPFPQLPELAAALKRKGSSWLFAYVWASGERLERVRFLKSVTDIF